MQQVGKDADSRKAFVKKKIERVVKLEDKLCPVSFSNYIFIHTCTPTWRCRVFPFVTVFFPPQTENYLKITYNHQPIYLLHLGHIGLDSLLPSELP